MKHSTTILLTLFVLQSYAHPRPQGTSISNIGSEGTVASTLVETSADASVSTNAVSNDIPLYTKQGFIQRNPTYYQDMFNIPIATLQAVSNLLSGTYTNTSVTKQSSISKNDQSLSFLKSSPLSQLPVEIPNDSTLIGSSSVAASMGAIPESNNNQITKGIIILRIPTIQDIFNIPISTLQAVSHFLTTTYGSQAPNVNNNKTTIKVSSINSESNAVTKEDQLPTFLKSSPVSQEPVETPSHSTLIGANVDISVAANPGSNNNQFNIKQLLQRNPTYYQDMFNIPIATLQAVSNFLTAAYTNTTGRITPAKKEGSNAVDQSPSLIASQSKASVETPSSANLLDNVTTLNSVQAVDESAKIITENELLKKENPQRA